MAHAEQDWAALRDFGFLLAAGVLLWANTALGCL